MKYYLKVVTDKKMAFNAGAKAVNDANVILESNGYIPICVNNNSKNTLIIIIKTIFIFLQIFFRVKKGDTLFIQHPIQLRGVRYIYLFLEKNNISIEILTHDLEQFRFSRHINTYNYIEKFYKSAKRVILHTPKMKEIVTLWGVEEDRINILYLFDYLTSKHNRFRSSFSQSILFAGNLDKSPFVKNLGECDKTNFVLYGKESSNIPNAENVSYNGLFAPDDISDIEGDWGLVWDGETTTMCSGVTGEYLKVNSSHKISLYIACEKPVIIWSESSLKDFIIENNLGFAVNSLSEISDIISNITTEQIDQYKMNLKFYSAKLKAGQMLSSLLN